MEVREMMNQKNELRVIQSGYWGFTLIQISDTHRVEIRPCVSGVPVFVNSIVEAKAEIDQYRGRGD
jgi:hypothetical protein